MTVGGRGPPKETKGNLLVGKKVKWAFGHRSFMWDAEDRPEILESYL